MSEMAVGGSLVVLGFAQQKVAGQSTQTIIKVHLDNVGDELGSEALLTSRDRCSCGLPSLLRWISFLPNNRARANIHLEIIPQGVASMQIPFQSKLCSKAKVHVLLFDES